MICDGYSSTSSIVFVFDGIDLNMSLEDRNLKFWPSVVQLMLFFHYFFYLWLPVSEMWVPPSLVVVWWHCFNLSKRTSPPTIRLVWQAKTQISLYIHPVRQGSCSSLFFDSSDTVEGTCDQRRLWSDCADAQPDQSLRLSHKSSCRSCRALAHFDLRIFSNVLLSNLWILCASRMMFFFNIRAYGNKLTSVKSI